MDLSGSTINEDNKRINDVNIAANDTYIKTIVGGGFNINTRPIGGFDGNLIIARKPVDLNDNAKYSLIRRITPADLANTEAMYDFAAGQIDLVVGIEAGTLTTGSIDVDIYSESYDPDLN